MLSFSCQHVSLDLQPLEYLIRGFKLEEKFQELKDSEFLGKHWGSLSLHLISKQFLRRKIVSYLKEGSITFCLVNFPQVLIRLVLIRLVLICLVLIRLVLIRVVLIRVVLIRLIHIRSTHSPSTHSPSTYRLLHIRLVHIRLVHIRLVLLLDSPALLSAVIFSREEIWLNLRNFKSV